MRILGVDPGTILTGFGIIEYNKNKLAYIASGVIRLPSGKVLSEKLEIIYERLTKIIAKFSLDEFSIETAFYGNICINNFYAGNFHNLFFSTNYILF